VTRSIGMGPYEGRRKAHDLPLNLELIAVQRNC
jgi:hypothetical protein